MTHNTDGNLASLRAYEREQDALADADQARDERRQEYADGLYDACLTGDREAMESMAEELQDGEPVAMSLMAAMAKEAERPITRRGSIIHKAVQTLLSDACEAIAKRRIP